MKISWYPASKLRPHSYLGQGGYVFTSVCLYVCLLTRLHKNYWSNTFHGTIGHNPGTSWLATEGQCQ